MEAHHHSSSRWGKILRGLFYVIGLPALAIICFYAEEDARGKGNWNAFKHEWEAKGENFDTSSYIPKAVPDDKNFALTPKKIIETLDLRRPIFKKTAAYGHFGRKDPDFTWEKTDKAAALREQAGLAKAEHQVAAKK